MKRKDFLGTIGTSGIAALGSFGCNKVISQPQMCIHWRMATSWDKELQNTIYGGPLTICERVKTLSQGKFVIELMDNNFGVQPLQVLDAVQKNVVQCGHTGSFYYTDKNPALAFGASVPFGFNAQQQNAWLYKAGGLELMREIYANFNIINFPAGNTGSQIGGWFKNEIPDKDFKDLKGVKMRIPGLGAEVMERLGADTYPKLIGKEITKALKNETINAAEWIGPYDDQKLGLNKLANYYYFPGWWEPSTTLELQVNKSEWKKLPKAYQEILWSACVEANSNMLASYNHLNSVAFQVLKLKNKKIKQIGFPNNLLKEAKKVAFDLYEEEAINNSDFRRVYFQWKDFRQQISEIYWLTEEAFARTNFNNKDKYPI